MQEGKAASPKSANCNWSISAQRRAILCALRSCAPQWTSIVLVTPMPNHVTSADVRQRPFAHTRCMTHAPKHCMAKRGSAVGNVVVCEFVVCNRQRKAENGKRKARVLRVTCPPLLHSSNTTFQRRHRSMSQASPMGASASPYSGAANASTAFGVSCKVAP